MDVDPSETERHSFIIRIWIEEATSSRRPFWRGSISHVPDGERRALHSLSDIARFIAPYLEALGVDLGPGWRVRRTLENWTRWRRGRVTPSSHDQSL